MWTARDSDWSGEGSITHSRRRWPLSCLSLPTPLRLRNGFAWAGGGALGAVQGGPGPARAAARPRPLTPVVRAPQPPRAGLLAGGGGCAGSRLQAEMLQMDLIDAAGDTPGAEDDEEDDEEERAARRPGAGPPEAGARQEPVLRSQGQGGGDTYRPKRPTTLNLFPQVPRSQVRPEQRGAGLKGGALGLGLGRGPGGYSSGCRGRTCGSALGEVAGQLRPPEASQGGGLPKRIGHKGRGLGGQRRDLRKEKWGIERTEF